MLRLIITYIGIRNIIEIHLQDIFVFVHLILHQRLTPSQKYFHSP
jgi:hypothetical protein